MKKSLLCLVLSFSFIQYGFTETASDADQIENAIAKNLELLHTGKYNQQLKESYTSNIQEKEKITARLSKKKQAVTKTLMDLGSKALSSGQITEEDFQKLNNISQKNISDKAQSKECFGFLGELRKKGLRLPNWITARSCEPGALGKLEGEITALRTASDKDIISLPENIDIRSEATQIVKECNETKKRYNLVFNCNSELINGYFNYRSSNAFQKKSTSSGKYLEAYFPKNLNEEETRTHLKAYCDADVKSASPINSFKHDKEFMASEEQIASYCNCYTEQWIKRLLPNSKFLSQKSLGKAKPAIYKTCFIDNRK